MSYFRIVSIISAFSLSFFINCGSDSVGITTLNVTFLAQPQGGSLSSTVSANIRFDRNFVERSAKRVVQTKPIPETIVATIEWWWQGGHGGGDAVVKTESVTISEDEKTVSTSYSAGPGFTLLNYYWVKVTWRDKDELETEHTKESSKGYFTKIIPAAIQD